MSRNLKKTKSLLKKLLTGKCSRKKLLWKILQNLQGNTYRKYLCQSLSFNKVAGLTFLIPWHAHIHKKAPVLESLFTKAANDKVSSQKPVTLLNERHPHKCYDLGKLFQYDFFTECQRTVAAEGSQNRWIGF